MKKNIIISVISVVLLSSCAQLSIFQDARTEGKGNTSIAATALLHNGSDGPDRIAPYFPVVYAQGSYGLTEKIDLQLSLSSSGTAFLNPKIQIQGDQNSKWAFSLNPGFEYQFGLDQPSQNFRIHGSFVSSFHPNEKTSWIVQPKFIRDYALSNPTNYLGSSIAFKLNNMGEISYVFGASALKNLNGDLNWFWCSI